MGHWPKTSDVTGPIAAGLTALILLTAPDLTQAQGAGTPEGHGYLSLQVENDMFGNGADRHYTHGTAASYFSEPCRHQWVTRMVKAIGLGPRTGASCNDSRVGLSLGQAIYTPADISRTVPDPTDRPYAGWLYVSAGLVSEDANHGGPDAQGPGIDRTLRKVEISLGVVGPASGAGAVQRNYHKLIGANEPRGWAYQLKNEPALMVSYEYLRRFGHRFTNGLEVDATPNAGISLGNVFTQGALGLTLRVGHDMLLDYGPPRIRPSLPGASFFQAPASGLGWYIFGGIEGRAVARNIFLDGNTFEDGPHVDKRHIVGDAQVGIAVTLGRVRLSYTNVFRTREFSGQPKPDNFGAFSASFRL